MTTQEITQQVDAAIARKGTWRIVVKRQTKYRRNSVRFEVEPHPNPNINEMTFNVSACDDPTLGRDFDACVNKSFDTKEQFINAVARALRKEPQS